MPRHGCHRHPNNQGNKRRYNERQQYEGRGGGEESVDDLMVASMHAAVSTWCEPPAPDVDDSSESDDSSDEGESDSSEESSDAESDSGDEKSAAHDDGSQGKEDEEEETTADTTADVSKSAEAEDNGIQAETSEGPIDDKDKANIDEDAAKRNESETPDNDQPNAALLRALENYESEEDSENENEGGDDSDIDLVDQLENMDDQDYDNMDSSPNRRRGKHKNQSNKSNKSSEYHAPKTENEIDLYSCPTDQLAKLNVAVGPDDTQALKSLKFDTNGALIVDEEIRRNVKIAGTIRSYIAEQRTVVVDSLIPTSLQSQCQNNNVSSPLDEGSLLVVVTNQSDEGNTCITISLGKGDEPCSLQVLGKVMEVFGPVQRPLYAIRLPDPPRAKPKANVEKADTGEKTPDAQIDGDEIELDEEANGDDETAVKKEDDLSNDKAADEHKASTATKSDSDTVEEDESLNKAKMPEDLWAPDGKLSIMLKSCPNAAVYCLMDHAKLIDTDQIIRVSGRGCDASNIYDEELGPSEQQYFSDDEQERQAKRGKRKSRKSNSDQDFRIPPNDGASRGGRGMDGGRGRGGRGGRGMYMDGGRGRGGRGRGRGRSHHEHHDNGSFNYSQRGPPQYHHHQQYPQAYQQPYHNQFPPGQQMHPQQHGAPLNPGYSQAMGLPYQQSAMYQQQQQTYQQQYPPQQPYGGQPMYAPQGQAMYGAPPPPPPQNGNMMPPQMPAAHYPQHQQSSQQQQQPQTESDTVYYDYSAA